MTTVDRLRAMHEAATGPWEAQQGERIWNAEGVPVAATYAASTGIETDAELIVAAVNALPKLLEVVEAARAVAEPGFDIAKNARLAAALAALEASDG